MCIAACQVQIQNTYHAKASYDTCPGGELIKCKFSSEDTCRRKQRFHQVQIFQISGTLKNTEKVEVTTDWLLLDRQQLIVAVLIMHLVRMQ